MGPGSFLPFPRLGKGDLTWWRESLKEGQFFSIDRLEHGVSQSKFPFELGSNTFVWVDCFQGLGMRGDG